MTIERLIDLAVLALLLTGIAAFPLLVFGFLVMLGWLTLRGLMAFGFFAPLRTYLVKKRGL